MDMQLISGMILSYDDPMARKAQESRNEHAEERNQAVGSDGIMKSSAFQQVGTENLSKIGLAIPLSRRR